MGGKSWTNPNRPYNYLWWFWYKIFRNEKLACWLCFGHRWYYTWPDPPLYDNTTCARCGTKIN